MSLPRGSLSGMATPNPAPPAPPAPATTSSGTNWAAVEQWAGKLLAAALTACYASGVIPTGGQIAKVAALASTVLIYLGFTVVRAKQLAAASSGASAVPVPTAQGGFVRVHVMALIAATAVAVSSIYMACGAGQKANALTCEESVLKKDITVNGIATTLGDAIEGAIATGTAGIPAALLGIASSLGMPVALDSISCALDLVEAAPPAVASGSAVGTTGETRAQRIAAARAWVAQQRAK